MKAKPGMLFSYLMTAIFIAVFAFLIVALVASLVGLFGLLIRELWSPKFALGLYSFIIIVVVGTLGMYWKDPLKFGGDKK